MTKILSIGNSFSEDAHFHLKGICEAGGIDVKLVNMHIGGCSIEKHMQRTTDGIKDYIWQVDAVTVNNEAGFFEIFDSDEWDIITINQASLESGRPYTYIPHLPKLKALIDEHHPKAKVYMHETWAYDTQPWFGIYHFNQREMYIRVHDSFKMAGKLIGVPVIPAGDVIQHLRDNIPQFNHSSGGKLLTRDGFHLSMVYGRYAVALTWYGLLFGKDVRANNYVPTVEGEQTDPFLVSVVKDAVCYVLAKGPDFEV